MTVVDFYHVEALIFVSDKLLADRPKILDWQLCWKAVLLWVIRKKSPFLYISTLKYVSILQ